MASMLQFYWLTIYISILALSPHQSEAQYKPIYPPYAVPAKRLMGIFRCSGWGPGCSHLNTYNTEMEQDFVHDSPGSGYPKVDFLRTGNTRLSLQSGVPSQGTESLKYNSKPFFTLTSGHSWGPTGKRTAGDSNHGNEITLNEDKDLAMLLENMMVLMRETARPEEKSRVATNPWIPAAKYALKQNGNGYNWNFPSSFIQARRR